jgi:hypothetical protein
MLRVPSWEALGRELLTFRDHVIEADYVRRRRQLVMDVVDQILVALPEKALMAANAMAIARRALLAGPVAALDDPALCAAIRGGAHDGDAALGAQLLAVAEAQCRISAPKAVE